MQPKTIVLASDHAGFKLKEVVKKFLTDKGYKIDDVGAFEYIEGDDYPEYMVKAGRRILEDIKNETKAIIFGGSGQGEAIVANRFPGVRAVVWYGQPDDSEMRDETIKKSREHNDANVLSIGAWFVQKNEAEVLRSIELWLNTPFSNEERHARRIEEIDSIE
jgi:ribose 5-phosphate isomerase B